MAYFTEQQLRDLRPAFGQQRRNILTEAAGADLTVFLSHSHRDRPLVEGLISVLDGIGIRLYVDWNDRDMPRVTNRETAERIKGQIRRNTLFMVLATDEALKSRWVPWEVGVADPVKGEDFILLIPVADASGTFRGNEFLQLYYHLDFGALRMQDWQRSRYRVLSPTAADSGSLLEHLQSVRNRRQVL
ncbi:MAG TPA: toll/interleukin-1 receptor domain-containing protein [Terriglobia bacterium]|nr:toll/interleukin-1 receptor domain-containing protein [Terriglobia bacterium]